MFDIEHGNRRFERPIEKIEDKYMVITEGVRETPSLGLDPQMAVDKYNKPEILGALETFAHCVERVLYMKPGQYPSLPYLGINISSYLYKFFDTLNERTFIDLLSDQCEKLHVYIDKGYFRVIKTIYENQPTLIIKIGTSARQENPGYESDFSYLNIGISFNTFNEMVTDRMKA
jgi:hypothetical protein